MRLLVFGKSGQVARELARRAPGAVFLERPDVDLEQPETCVAAITAEAPDAVINAAAYTAVDRAETEEALATRINGAAPGAMAGACAALGIPFVQISTDYVFDGTGDRPWSPGDPAAPLSAYGRSKLAGEAAVQAAGGVHAILRTSWVVSAHGSNFLKTMLTLSETRDRLTIVADQIGGPTSAGGIAAACLTIAEALRHEPAKTGTYHYAGAPDVSWAGFACEIFAKSGRAVTVEELSTAEYYAGRSDVAPRPLNSRMDCAATQAAFGIARPDWRQDIATIIEELT